MTPAHRLRAETLAAYNAAKDALAAEITEATEAIRAKHQPHINTLYKAFTDADDALRRVTSDTATHPWEGKKVERTEYSGRAYRYIPYRKTGVVEIRRIDTEFPANKHPPKIGEAFVRRCKATGEVGKDFAPLTSEWRLCDVG
jgi:hypothetical protein